MEFQTDNGFLFSNFVIFKNIFVYLNDSDQFRILQLQKHHPIVHIAGKNNEEKPK